MVNWGQLDENDTLSSFGTSSSTLSLNSPNLLSFFPSLNQNASAPSVKPWCKPAAIESHYPTDVVLKEIDRAFKETRGETSFEFNATRLEHGMVAIRNAIRRNIEDLLNREKQEHVGHWGNWNDLAEPEEKHEGDAKNIKKAIQDARTQALEYRVKILEGLLLEYGEGRSDRS